MVSGRRVLDRIAAPGGGRQHEPARTAPGVRGDLGDLGDVAELGHLAELALADRPRLLGIELHHRAGSASDGLPGGGRDLDLPSENDDPRAFVHLMVLEALTRRDDEPDRAGIVGRGKDLRSVRLQAQHVPTLHRILQRVGSTIVRVSGLGSRAEWHGRGVSAGPDILVR